MWARQAAALAGQTQSWLRAAGVCACQPVACNHPLSSLASASFLAETSLAPFAVARYSSEAAAPSSPTTSAMTPSPVPEPRRRIPRWSNNTRTPKPQVDPGTGQAPWTPTSQLQKRKVYPKRMRHLIGELNDEYLKQRQEEKKLPQLKSGQIVTVHLVVPELDMRTTTWSGIVLSLTNRGPMSRITVRNVLKGTGAVERSFLLHSPFVKGITVHRATRVRRAKLTYLRERRDAESTFAV